MTFTKNVKSGRTTVAKSAQVLWTVTANDAKPTLDFNTAGGVVESGVVGLDCGDLMAFAATPGAKVTASGLPAGLSLVDLGGGNWGFAGFTTKAGTYLVTVTAKVNGNAVSQRVALKVDALPAWAKGTFYGYVGGTEGTNGLAKITVSSVGKISGKFEDHGTNWTISASSYADFDGTAYEAAVTAKYSYKVKVGKTTESRSLTREFALSVSEGPVGGVATMREPVGSAVEAWQNLWGRADYKALGKKLFYTSKSKQYRTFTIYGTDEDGAAIGLSEAETLSLKVTPAGAVTATLSFDTGVRKTDPKTKKTVAVIYKPTYSTYVIPKTSADSDPFEGEAFVYFAPSPENGFPGFVACVPF